MPAIAAEYVDRLVATEMRRPTQLRGVAHRLYEAAREEAGRPLSLNAAELLLDSCQEGSVALFTCSAGGPPWLPHGETDGPLGAVAIARALAATRGVVPIFVAADFQAPPIGPTCRAAGLLVMDPQDAMQRTWAASIVSFDAEGDGRSCAQRLLDTYQPSAVVAIETLGPNRAGITHSIMGKPFRDAPPYHALFTLAAERGITSLGIGDGGNEIGFGRVIESVMQIQEFGNVCQCDCGQGMATVATTDALVAAAVSNWGGHGVAAMIALLSKRVDALHDAPTELRMLEACSAAGAADGSFANLALRVDGIDGQVSADMVNMLRTIVSLALEDSGRRRPF